jgi:hypothetical protein
VSRLLLVWVHVTAAAVWVGGTLQAGHLLAPALARGEGAALGLLLRWRAVSWGALAVLALTGIEQLRRVGLESRWLALKILLVLGLLAVAAHRDFALLPRARRAIEAGGAPGPALRAVRWFDRGLALLALAVLLLAVGVARGR